MTKRLLITLDDDTAKELAKSPNMSKTVREALKIYNGDISTDTVNGLRQSYVSLRTFMEDRFDKYDISFHKLDKLIEYLETRMM